MLLRICIFFHFTLAVNCLLVPLGKEMSQALKKYSSHSRTTIPNSRMGNLQEDQIESAVEHLQDVGFGNKDDLLSVLTLKHSKFPNLKIEIQKFERFLPNFPHSLINEYSLAQIPRAWSVQRLFLHFTKAKASEMFHSCEEFLASLQSNGENSLVLQCGEYRKEFFPNGQLKMWTDNEKFTIERKISNGKSIITYTYKSPELTFITLDEVECSRVVARRTESSTDLLFGIRYNSDGIVDYLGYIDAHSFQPHGVGIEFFSKREFYIGTFANGLFSGKGTIKINQKLINGISTNGIFQETVFGADGEIPFGLFLDNRSLRNLMNRLEEPLHVSGGSRFWDCNQFMRDYINLVIRPRSSSSVYICPQFTEHASKWSFLACTVKGFGFFDWYDHVIFPVEHNSIWNLWIYDMRLERCTVAQANNNGKHPMPTKMYFKFAFESLKERLGICGRKSFYLSDSSLGESSHESFMSTIRRIMQVCHYEPQLESLKNLSSLSFHTCKEQELKLLHEFVLSSPKESISPLFLKKLQKTISTLEKEMQKQNVKPMVSLDSFPQQFLRTSPIRMQSKERYPNCIVTIRQTLHYKMMKINRPESARTLPCFRKEETPPTDTFQEINPNDCLMVIYVNDGHLDIETTHIFHVDEKIINEIEANCKTLQFDSVRRIRDFVETFLNAVSLIHNDLQIYGLGIEKDTSNIFYEDSKRTVAFKRLTKTSLPELEQKVQITKDLVKLGTLFYNSIKKSIVEENFLLCDLVFHLASCHRRKELEPKMNLANHPFLQTTKDLHKQQQ